jgi:lysophospholipase L1-like esterase
MRSCSSLEAMVGLKSSKAVDMVVGGGKSRSRAQNDAAPRRKIRCDAQPALWRAIIATLALVSSHDDACGVPKMRPLLLSLLFVLLVSSPQLLTASSTSIETCTLPMARPKFLLLGDSLTQLSFDGWAAQLAHVYQRRADVLNRGMSGYNTDWYVQYYVQNNRDDVLVKDDVRLITIFFGANDASSAQHNPHHHVPVEDYQSNLGELIDLCRAQYGDSVAMIIMTPPPVQHEQRLEYQKQRYPGQETGILERTLELSGEYANAAETVAMQHKLPCLNLWKAMQQDAKWDRFFYDGLHFTKEGNAFVFEALFETIQSHYPDLTVTADPVTQQWCNSASSCPSLPQSGPYHDEIDHKNPAKAFETHYATRN